MRRSKGSNSRSTLFLTPPPAAAKWIKMSKLENRKVGGRGDRREGDELEEAVNPKFKSSQQLQFLQQERSNNHPLCLVCRCCSCTIGDRHGRGGALDRDPPQGAGGGHPRWQREERAQRQPLPAPSCESSSSLSIRCSAVAEMQRCCCEREIQR